VDGAIASSHGDLKIASATHPAVPTSPICWPIAANIEELVGCSNSHTTKRTKAECALLQPLPPARELLGGEAKLSSAIGMAMLETDWLAPGPKPGAADAYRFWHWPGRRLLA